MSDDKKIVTIDQGEDKPFNIYLYGADGRPFDLTGYDKFTLSLPAKQQSMQNGILITETVSTNGSIITCATPTLGVLAVLIKRLDSVAVKSGGNQDGYLQIENTVAVTRKRIKLPGMFNVEETPLANP